MKNNSKNADATLNSTRVRFVKFSKLINSRTPNSRLSDAISVSSESKRIKKKEPNAKNADWTFIMENAPKVMNPIAKRINQTMPTTSPDPKEPRPNLHLQPTHKG